MRIQCFVCSHPIQQTARVLGFCKGVVCNGNDCTHTTLPQHTMNIIKTIGCLITMLFCQTTMGRRIYIGRRIHILFFVGARLHGEVFIAVGGFNVFTCVILTWANGGGGYRPPPPPFCIRVSVAHHLVVDSLLFISSSVHRRTQACRLPLGWERCATLVRVWLECACARAVCSSVRLVGCVRVSMFGVRPEAQEKGKSNDTICLPPSAHDEGTDCVLHGLDTVALMNAQNGYDIMIRSMAY